MKLLISATTLDEARRCILGRVPILDVKNPAEGSLGGHSPRVIRQIRALLPGDRELSATIGDVIDRTGWVSQAALGLAVCGVDYIKFGLCDKFSPVAAIALVREVVATVKEASGNVKIVVCGYADAREHGFIPPEAIPEVVARAGADVAMIDTLEKKDGRGLFDHLSEDALAHFCREARASGSKAALAGRLRMEDVLRIRDMKCCDIIGIRSLACRDAERNKDLDPSRIAEIVGALA